MRIEPAASLRGDLAVPGDKSISHRALLLGAIALASVECDLWLGARDAEARQRHLKGH